MVRCNAGVFFFKVLLYYVYYLCGLCGDLVSGWVSNGFEVGLVLCIGLKTRCGFEVVVVSFRALLV